MKNAGNNFQGIKTEVKRNGRRWISGLLALIILILSTSPAFASEYLTDSVKEKTAESESSEIGGDDKDFSENDEMESIELPFEDNEGEKSSALLEAETDEVDDQKKADEEAEEETDDTESNAGKEEVESEELMLTDETTGVSIVVPIHSMPEGITRENLGIQVRNLTENEMQEHVETVGVAEENIIWAYDISLIDIETDKEVQPDGEVIVTVPEEMPENSMIIRIEHEGGYTPLEAEKNGEEVSFETEHFSIYSGVEFGHII